MKTSPAKSSNISNRRCTHVFANGKRCRDFTSKQSDYCRRHTTLHDERREAEDVSDALTSGIDDLKNPAAIHDLLSRLLLLLAQDRISPRRAAVLFYGSGLLLRATAAMNAAMQEEANDPSKFQYIIGVPRPDYDESETPTEPVFVTANQ